MNNNISCKSLFCNSVHSSNKKSYCNTQSKELTELIKEPSSEKIKIISEENNNQKSSKLLDLDDYINLGDHLF